MIRYDPIECFIYYFVRLDLEGKVMRTHYSNQTRDSFLNIPIERVDPFLRALRKFDDLMYQNHITFKLKAGEC